MCLVGSSLSYQLHSLCFGSGVTVPSNLSLLSIENRYLVLAQCTYVVLDEVRLGLGLGGKETGPGTVPFLSYRRIA